MNRNLMRLHNAGRGIASVALACLLASCATAGSRMALQLTDVKMCRGLTDAQEPKDVTTVFPAGTEVVYCWFSWQEAPPNTEVVSRWSYVPDNLQVLDIPVRLTRDTSAGVFVLRMPSGKPLPGGMYQVDLMAHGHILRSIPFNVELPK